MDETKVTTTKSPRISPSFEVVWVEEKQVFCSGETLMGHPGVYLHVGKEGQVLCPYCSKCFQHRSYT
jgi:uncharacterized Zn-finger protein